MYRGREKGARRFDRGGHHHHRRSSRHYQPFRPPHQAFDLWLADEFFPRVNPAPDNDTLAKALIARHSQLQPSPAQQTQITDLLTKVTTVLDNIIVTQTGQESHALEEVRPVGSHKQGTALADDKCAELVVLFKTWPTVKGIEEVGKLVLEGLQNLQESSGSMHVSSDKTGFTVKGDSVEVRCHATMLPESWLEPTTSDQVVVSAIDSALALIRRTRWFEENVTQTGTRMLIRILTDLGSRLDGFKHLSQWMITLLGFQASVVQNRRDVLPITEAFRRAMRLLAAGFFLPHNEGIPDPCEPTSYRVHHALGFEKQEALCCSAQTVLRLLSHGAHNEILGLKKDCHVDFNATMNCGGVIVSPSLCVYEKEETNGDTTAPENEKQPTAQAEA